MKPGAVLVTLGRLPLGPCRKLTNEYRRRQGLETSNKASFFEMEEVSFNETCLVSWSYDLRFSLYKYTRCTDVIVIATTTTGPGGTYEFTDIPPGNYVVEEKNPPGYSQDVSPNVINVTLAPGEDKKNNNFIVTHTTNGSSTQFPTATSRSWTAKAPAAFVPVSPAFCRISGKVTDPENNPLPGAKITLKDITCTFLCCNPACEKGKKMIPIKAWKNDENGRVVLNRCDCKHDIKPLRKRKLDCHPPDKRKGMRNVT